MKQKNSAKKKRERRDGNGDKNDLKECRKRPRRSNSRIPFIYKGKNLKLTDKNNGITFSLEMFASRNSFRI